MFGANTIRHSGRKLAIALQYIGMLVFFGAFGLQLFWAIDKRTVIYYDLVAATALGCGVLLRRYYDKD